jgi:hypothetical protein
MKPFKLDNEPKMNSGFKIPETYFDDFTEKVMQQLPKQERVKVIPLYKRKPVWMSAVAAVFVITLGVSIIWKSNGSNTAVPDDTTIVNYLAYEDDITEEDIIQGLSQQDIKELEASITVSDEAIEDYLSTKDYDIYLNE